MVSEGPIYLRERGGVGKLIERNADGLIKY